MFWQEAYCILLGNSLWEGAASNSESTPIESALEWPKVFALQCPAFQLRDRKFLHSVWLLLTPVVTSLLSKTLATATLNPDLKSRCRQICWKIFNAGPTKFCPEQLRHLTFLQVINLNQTSREFVAPVSHVGISRSMCSCSSLALSHQVQESSRNLKRKNSQFSACLLNLHTLKCTRKQGGHFFFNWKHLLVRTPCWGTGGVVNTAPCHLWELLFSSP